VLSIIAALTAVCGLVLTRVEYASSIIESFVNRPEDYQQAMALEAEFSTNPDSLVWLATRESDEVFHQATLAKIVACDEALTSLPEIRNVVSLADLRLSPSVMRGTRSTAARAVLNAKLKSGEVPEQALESARNALSLSRIVRRADELDKELSAAQIQVLRDEAGAQGGGRVQLVSKAGTAQLMLIELNNAQTLPPEEQIATIQSIEDAVRNAGLGSEGLYLSGLVPMQSHAYQQIDIVLRTLLPVGGALIALAVMLVFKRFEVIVFTLLIAAISNVWGIALGVAFYGKFSVLMAAVPLMVLVISTADVIHLLSSYTAERTAGHDHKVSLRKMYLEVGGACILTSITTFVGFASLVFVPSKTIRQFGFSAAAGVASALVLSVLLAPLFLQWLSYRKRPITAAANASRLANMIAKSCLKTALARPWLTVAFAAIFFVVAGIATSRLTLDPDLANRFQASHPLTKSTRFLSSEFGGVNVIEFVVTVSDNQLYSPEIVKLVTQFEDRCVRETPAVGAFSLPRVIVDTIGRIDAGSSGVPESVAHGKAIYELLQAVDGEGLAALRSADERTLRLGLQVEATSYMRLLDVSEQARRIADEVFGDRAAVREKGSAPLIGKAVREIIRGHLQGFVFCFTTIFFLIVVGLRSFKFGWLSILPNITPLLVLGGLLSIYFDRVDSDILAVATLGLGLAVDDTIHFMSRIRLELRHTPEIRTALERTMQHTGVAIVRTTWILSVGFLPFGLSDYWSIRMLGTYLVAVLFAALIADLLLLPAILYLAFRERPVGSQ
jgi:hypothetical protein